MTLQWELAEPEEDPGIVKIVLQRRDEYAVVVLTGPSITGDPRTLNLPVTIEDMVAILEDPDLRLETSPAAIEAGRILPDWAGGEPA
jgi:hypothetical protein